MTVDWRARFLEIHTLAGPLASWGMTHHPHNASQSTSFNFRAYAILAQSHTSFTFVWSCQNERTNQPRRHASNAFWISSQICLKNQHAYPQDVQVITGLLSYPTHNWLTSGHTATCHIKRLRLKDRLKRCCNEGLSSGVPAPFHLQSFW